jgi:hypothetical protein
VIAAQVEAALLGLRRVVLGRVDGPEESRMLRATQRSESAMGESQQHLRCSALDNADSDR